MPIAAIAAPIVGGILGSRASGNAANAQVQAANHAADVQQQLGNRALQFQQDVWNQQQQNEAPFIQQGQSAVNALGQLLQQQPLENWNQTWQAPTIEQARQSPGYQFQMQEGLKALQRSAAAKGNLMTGGTAKAIEQYGQGLADSNYQQVYNRALNDYQTNYGTWLNKYNQVASLAGLGQTANQALGAMGSNAADNNSRTSLGLGQQLGNDYMNAGNARASGYINSANAWNGALGGATNALNSSLLMYGLMG